MATKVKPPEPPPPPSAEELERQRLAQEKASEYAGRPQDLRYLVDERLVRMTGHGDHVDRRRHATGELGGARRAHLAWRRREHETDRIGTGIDRRRHGRLARQAADLDVEIHEAMPARRTARPASIICRPSATGSGALISAVPTSARP